MSMGTLHSPEPVTTANRGKRDAARILALLQSYPKESRRLNPLFRFSRLMGSTGRIISTRYHAIDAIRGFCLVNIFITHLSTSMIKEASPSKLGFSDSAEIFVLLAGISTSIW